MYGHILNMGLVLGFYLASMTHALQMKVRSQNLVANNLKTPLSLHGNFYKLYQTGKTTKCFSLLSQTTQRTF